MSGFCGVEEQPPSSVPHQLYSGDIQHIFISVLKPDPEPEPQEPQLFALAEPKPDSIKSVDSYPDSESGSESSRAKMTHKNLKKFRNFSCFEMLDVLF